MRCLLFVLCVAAPALTPAAGPATLPASVATTQSQSDIQRWLGDLADDDANIREQARVSLMGLPRSDLPLLRQITSQSLPLQPSQSAVLRDIVSQIYLAGETYESLPNEGFLGVMLPPPNEVNENGLVVIERIRGFCGFRMLQQGDIILSIRESPQVPLRDSADLTNAIKGMGSGALVHLEIIRRGQVIQIPVTLDARPRAAGIPEMETFLRERDEATEALWQRDFAPLLNQSMS